MATILPLEPPWLYHRLTLRLAKDWQLAWHMLMVRVKVLVWTDGVLSCMTLESVTPTPQRQSTYSQTTSSWKYLPSVLATSTGTLLTI